MNRNDLIHNETDTWYWTRAANSDVPEIVAIAENHYQAEIDGILTPNPTRLSYNLHRAILEQTYVPGSQLISVAKSKTTNFVIAWSWCARGHYTAYAEEEMAVAEFAHCAMDIALRNRIRLVGQMFDQWISWCELNSIPVLCSTSIREDQAGFMRLHDIYGFKRKGSFAYRRIV